MSRVRSVLLAAALLIGACSSDDEAPGPPPTGPVGSAIPTASAAQRLTRAQYANAIHDLFGPEIVVPTGIEPDIVEGGLEAIGSNNSTVSVRGIEQYEAAAFKIGEQVIANPTVRARIVTCAPSGPGDAACARTFVSALGPRVYRRPLVEAEITSATNVVVAAGTALGSFDKGIVYGITRLLLSPSFLYRPSVGEPDPENPGRRRLTGYELATRLSFFLWNSIPDDALLESAKNGSLHGYDGVSREVERMLASPKAKEGLRSFVLDWLRLSDLDNLTKDSTLFTTYTTDLGPMAREETLRVFESLVFDEDADIREVMTTRRTFVTPKLASMYQVLAPSASGFAPVLLPEDGPRRGLLGQISFLAQNAHPTSSSAVLRGKFVREKLLCTIISPPPVDLNTGFPDSSPRAGTLRERSQIHFAPGGCAGCHKMTDPIGFGLEPFDGIGRQRTKENGAVIDPSGELDGKKFDGPASLAQAIHDHPRFAPCMARILYQYATGSEVPAAEEPTVDALAKRFAATDYRFKALLAAIATSPAFRAHGDPH